MTQDIEAGRVLAGRQPGRLVQNMAGMLFSALTLFLARRRHRKALRALSDRQLRDAGIDYAAAGRGRSAAVQDKSGIHVGL